MITAVSFFSFIFIPSIVKETDVKLDCNDEISNFKYCLPDANATFVESQCALDRITSVNDTSQMLCRSRCVLNSTAWESICKNWKIQPICNDIARNEIEFDSYVPREHITPVANCLHLRVDRVQFDYGNLSYLHCPKDLPFFEIDCKVSCNDSDVTDIIAPGISDKEVSVTNFID